VASSINDLRHPAEAMARDQATAKTIRSLGSAEGRRAVVSAAATAWKNTSTTDKAAVITGAALGVATAVAGGVAASGSEAAGGTTQLFRAVMPAEAESIGSTGAFSNPFGIETKYFATSLEGAQSYASQASTAFGDGPFSFFTTAIPTGATTPEMRVTVDGIESIVVPTEDLSKLAAPTPVASGQ